MVGEGRRYEETMHALFLVIAIYCSTRIILVQVLHNEFWFTWRDGRGSRSAVVPAFESQTIAQ